MKLLLLATAVSVTASLQAQEVIVTDKAKLFERALRFQLSGMDTLKEEKTDPIVLSRDGRVRILPQDGMPCVVPDTRDIAQIPNAFKARAQKDPRPGRIPNAWPDRRKPDREGAR